MLDRRGAEYKRELMGSFDTHDQESRVRDMDILQPERRERPHISKVRAEHSPWFGMCQGKLDGQPTFSRCVGPRAPVYAQNRPGGV